MFALLGSSIGKYVLIALGVIIVVLAGYAYFEWSQGEINTLKANMTLLQKQADDLTLANTKIQDDVASIKVAQDTANQNIAKISDAAAQSSKALRASLTQVTNQAKTAPKPLETKINSDQAAIFKSLEDLSR